MSDRTGEYTIAVSTGDPAGSSPSLIPPLIDNCPDFLSLTFLGPAGVRERMDVDQYTDGTGRHQWIETGEVDTGAVLSGNLSEQTGQAAFQSLEKARNLCRNRRADGLLTLPLSKKAVREAGHESFRGHTAYLETQWDCRSVMTFFGDTLSVALLTRHIPLRLVPETLTVGFVEQQVLTLSDFYESYEEDTPDFALLGLNPHAGEQGLIGDREGEVLAPVLRRLRERGVVIDGPFAADSFFAVHADRYDCVVACYHDQGLIPFKVNHFYTGVHASVGLPVPRVSPDHGVAADLAGTGEIDERSTVNSLRHLARWLSG